MSEWESDGTRNGWKMPKTTWWKKLPVVRHARFVYNTWQVERHYNIGIGQFGLRSGYDQWVLFGIWLGK